MTALDSLLESYRTQAATQRDKGTAFEKLIAAWIVADPVQSKRIAKAELWGDWARRRGVSQTDVGIDLVCTRHDGGLVAAQCKLFDPDRRILKSDIDSFISASSKDEFAERVIVETTEVPWSENASAMVADQSITTTSIGLQDLRDSRVDWSRFAATGDVVQAEPKTLRDDQTEALEDTVSGLKAADRGKLIMACGTGKTLTSLRIAEELAGEGGYVLYLVPSLALMAQTVPEWCADTLVPITAFAVCSDTQVGKRRRSTFDVAEIEVTDLAFPATTKADKLAPAIAASDGGSMRVIFATYQSVSVIEQAQSEHGLPEFDLIVCDEAHRTTGVTFAGEDQSNFVKVHNNDKIRGRKRIYMTATPRIYGENARSKAREADAILASMDDPELFGDVLFHHGFARAVESKILTDYRVIVLAMDESVVNGAVQKRLADENSELTLDDATKIAGCWKALSKFRLKGLAADDTDPMHRALAFCRNIKSSKMVRDEFGKVIVDYRENEPDTAPPDEFDCEIKHVDGTYKARARKQRLDWLKEDAGPDVCRILSNARCLTEGVDVPALDAIMFLHPRNSQIDVVQAVGRVMRKAPDKRMGYVILPVGIPAGVPADVALNDNKKYRVVWQILNALRAHDERLDAVINQGGLGQDVSDRITIIDDRAIAADPELEAVTATVENLPTRRKRRGLGVGNGGSGGHEGVGEPPPPEPRQLVIDEFSRAVMAKIVEKCGTRDYWEDWAKDVAEIAERHITRIRSLVEQEGSDAHGFFQDFLKEVRDDLNEAVSADDAIEMLAQHLITRPVFEAVFEGHEFVERNPVSQAMTEVLSVIDEAQLGREAKKLEGFYASVRRRAGGITDPQARQALIVELYVKFFRNAFPLTTQKLGIVYTPVEIVDFIIHSVNDVLQDEFGQTLGSEGVHILDPFVGTGTFITRLLQSDLIAPDELERKYREEIHCNELVLLAYYIAAINIETVFHAIADRDDYLPFEGICLTDSFGLHEGEDELSFYMQDNTTRRERQKGTDIRVIFGNPPYSVGQRSANDNAQNVAYARLDERVRATYSRRGAKGTKRTALYDSYIRAIRWGSDRLGDAGVMAYVSGSAWVERAFADGMRRCLGDDFNSIHVFHLRGDIRKNILSGGRAGEGENVFGQGSMTGIAITLFVKNSTAKKQSRIFLHDIGDNLQRRQKLDIIRRFGSTRGIEEAGLWSEITPDVHGDWLDQRDTSFDAHPKIGDKKGRTVDVIFRNYSRGVATNRDVWCVNPSRTDLLANLKKMVSFYNSERARWTQATGKGQASSDVKDFVNYDPTRISWGADLLGGVTKGQAIGIDGANIVTCMYRPFTKQSLYFSPNLNWSLYQLPKIFPLAGVPNRGISVTGKGGRSGFSARMMDTPPECQTIANGQCFPLWLYYDAVPDAEPDMLADLDTGTGVQRRDAITDYALERFTSAYPTESICREDIFHYIYGLLHSEDYRERFRANLTKELPRIPCVASVEDYRTFRDAGQHLGELHVGYESVDRYPADIDTGGASLEGMDLETAYRVTKMRHPGTGRNKDITTVIYNRHITVRGIPNEAWDYVVSGKPALQWVMLRQCVKTHKASGIVSDANRYAIETVGDPRYPLDLLLRLITVSLQTMMIVRALPEISAAPDA